MYGIKKAEDVLEGAAVFAGGEGDFLGEMSYSVSLALGMGCNRIIRKESMAMYYGGL